jgi:hypothetical protein
LYFLKSNFQDSTNGRPLVGYTVINERQIDYTTTNYRQDIKTLVHEIFHALFFDPSLFSNNFPMHDGNPFYFNDGGIQKIQGESLLSVIRSHFNCPTANGGKKNVFEEFLILKFLIISSFRRWWRSQFS